MGNWIVFIIASCVLIGVGYMSGRKIQQDEVEGEGFLLGAKSIGPFIGAGTLMATGYSGWGFIGSPGTAYAFGTIEVLANFFFAPAITFGTLWFANYMRKNAESMGGLTVPEYLSKIHRGTEGQKRRVHLLAGFATLLFLTVYIVGQIRAVGLVASKWLGVSETLAATILLIVVVIFTMQGGLLAVAITDTIMCIGMLVSAVIVVVVIRKDITFTKLIHELGQMDSEIINPTTANPYGGNKYQVFLVFIYALLFTTTLPYMSVRFLSLKEDLKVHKMALYMAPMGFVLSFIPMVGLYMRYKNPTLENPDSAMPVFLNTYLHPAIGGIITLFILFAMLSTISSVLQTQASALSHDMYVSIRNKMHPKGDKFNRVMVLVIALVSLWLTFVAPQGMLNQIAYIGTGGLIAMFLGPTIVEVFIKGNANTCFASMLAGLITNVVLVLGVKTGWVEAPIMGGIVSAVVYAVMGYITNGNKRIPDGYKKTN
ncbi:MAG: sodium:solute symporter family protein [Lagierella massiliensis]|nr:sodium:solute symporter family protein [Lagierella massiliensis]